MEKMTGFDVLPECRRSLPQTAVILITAYASVEKAVEAMKLGAYDFITKPFKIDELKFTVQRALDYQSAVRENVYLKKEIKNRYRFENIVGTSRAMPEVYNLINKVADTDSTILIQGESGTGKELVARALHFNSKRQNAPFVAVNCSALPENLLESELFGHKKGAFTGAFQDKIGLFEEAECGTIFLDEVNSMALSLQTKLLRVLQERMIRRVGDTKTVPINVRVVAASNEQLQAKMRNGSFREDLFYRLAVIPVDLPSLRERTEDIPLLVNYFLQKNASHEQHRAQEDRCRTRSRCWAAMRGPATCASWRIQSSVRAPCARTGLIRIADLPPHVQGRQGGIGGESNIIEMPIGLRLEEFIANEERAYIEQTLRHNNGSREKTASMLGISMATLYRKLELGKQKQRA